MKTYKLTQSNRREIKKAIFKMNRVIFAYRKIEAEGTFDTDRLADLGDWSMDVEDANNTATMGLDFTQMDADTKVLE
jgi:hypothetical protein